MMASSAPSGTVLMYPNPTNQRELLTNTNTASSNLVATQSSSVAVATTTTTTAASTAPDISLRQRAVAKLRMFNFHLNWDLQMTHCKPCG